MRIQWTSGPRETQYGELRPGEHYDLPDVPAAEFIANGLAKRADMRTYPERTARKKAEHEIEAPASGGND